MSDTHRRSDRYAARPIHEDHPDTHGPVLAWRIVDTETDCMIACRGSRDAARSACDQLNARDTTPTHAQEENRDA